MEYASIEGTAAYTMITEGKMPGDYVHFRCGYMAMLTACTSAYVTKEFKK